MWFMMWMLQEGLGMILVEEKVTSSHLKKEIIVVEVMVIGRAFRILDRELFIPHLISLKENRSSL